MLSLVSFTSWPTTGRSSGFTSFIPFKTAVSSPFFPRKATRTSFNLESSPESSIWRIASSLIFWSFSFIMFSFFIDKSYYNKKRSTHPRLGTKWLRVTTLIPEILSSQTLNLCLTCTTRHFLLNLFKNAAPEWNSSTTWFQGYFQPAISSLCRIYRRLLISFFAFSLTNNIWSLAQETGKFKPFSPFFLSASSKNNARTGS